MMSIRAREGDFIETIEGLIFDVKGLVHPPDRIIAYLRYIPDPSGDRIRKGIAYRKVYSLNEREAILRRYYPQYIRFDPIFGMEMQGVPKKRILKVYRPQEALQALMEKSILSDLERSAVISFEHSMNHLMLGLRVWGFQALSWLVSTPKNRIST